MPFLNTESIRVAVYFSAATPFEGSLCLQGHAEPDCLLTLILQRAGQALTYEMEGNDCYISINFVDADVLIVLARRSGAIVASGVFEIDLSMISTGFLLIPRAQSNLIVGQHNTAPPSPVVKTESTKAVRTW